MAELPEDPKAIPTKLAKVTISFHGSPADGLPSTEPYPEGRLAAVPDRVGKFVVIDRLGTGGQGSALLARDPDFGRLVVLKRYHTSARDPDAEAALQDGRALARLRSRYAPHCYGLERDGDDLILVMEYIPGRSLSQIITSGLPAAGVAARWIEHVAEGLEAVHACGLLHRDIKPANIVLGDDGVPRLVDFGLAAHLGSLALQGISGTPQYMAPEQARGQWERIDGRTDVYEVGAVLYSLLTGTPPHPGATVLDALEHARRGELTPPRTLKRSIPQALERIVLKAMAADPAQRYSSAAELRRALRFYRLWHINRLPAAAVSIVIGLALLLSAPAWIGWVRGIGGAAGSRAPGPFRVTSFEVERFLDRGDGQAPSTYGVLGRTSFEAAERDFVRVSATLSEPAYCFLVAFNPDGSVQLCYPPGETGSPDETVAPPATDRVEYPTIRSRYFQLTDGRGRQAFVLIVGKEPLPPFSRWRARLADAPWPALVQPDVGVGVWNFDDREIQPIHAASDGARGTEVDRAPAALVELCSFLKTSAGATTFRGVTFPVR